MAIGGADFQWFTRSLAGAEVLAGQPAAAAAALAVAWAAALGLAAVVVVDPAVAVVTGALDVVVEDPALVVVVVDVPAAEDFECRLIRYTETPTTATTTTMMTVLRNRDWRFSTLAWAARLASRPARCRALFSLGTGGNPIRPDRESGIGRTRRAAGACPAGRARPDSVDLRAPARPEVRRDLCR